MIKRFVLTGEGYSALKVARIITDNPNSELVLIFTSLDKKGPLVEFARENDIKLYCTTELRSPDIVKWLHNLNGDWFINILSPVIVPIQVLDLFPGRALNLHTGPLPRYAGMHAHQWGIRNGETSFSATIHQMNAGIDTGDIVVESHFKISPIDTGLSLFNKVVRSGVELFEQIIVDITQQKKISGYSQNISNRHYYHHCDALDGRINWEWSPITIVNFIRAGNYKPFISPTYTATLDGDILIFSAEIDKSSSKKVGELIELTDLGPIISCGNNESVRITSAERNAQKMDINAWNQYFKNIVNHD